MSRRMYKNVLRQPLPISLNSGDISIQGRGLIKVEEHDWNSPGILRAEKAGQLVMIEEILDPLPAVQDVAVHTVHTVHEVNTQPEEHAEEYGELVIHELEPEVASSIQDSIRSQVDDIAEEVGESSIFDDSLDDSLTEQQDMFESSEEEEERKPSSSKKKIKRRKSAK